MPDLNLTRRRIEDLPSDGGQVVDTLSGAVLRFFVQLRGLDDAVARLGRRLAALEGPQPQRSATEPSPAATETASAAPKPAPKRSRGRTRKIPARSSTRPKPNGREMFHREDLEAWRDPA